MILFRLFLKLAAFGLALIVALGLFGAVYLWVQSPGEAQPILTEQGTPMAGSLSSIETFTIGGVEQSVILRAHSDSAPILLMLHGGPGTPAYPFARARNHGFEADFIVAYWEQRGAGLSFDPDADIGALTVDQLVADTGDLAEQLAARFGQDRIYLFGHSWGGALAILAAQARDDLYHQVFVVSPVIAQYEAEQRAFTWLNDQARETDDAAMQASLDQITLPAVDASGPEWLSYLGPQRRWLDQLGNGTAHDPIAIWQLARMLADTREYSIADKWRYVRASRASLQQLWPEIVALDLRNSVPALSMPLMIVHGAHDRITPPDLSRGFLDGLTAPDAGTDLHIFDSSAHSALFEDPDTFNAILRDALIP